MLATFELTVAQQRAIIVLLLIFVVAVAVKNYRERMNEQPPAAIAQPSPSPGTRP
jgi:hypothetical protein